MWGDVTSLDKSVFFWARQIFKYEYGGDLRGENPRNLHRWIFKINAFLKQMKGGCHLDHFATCWRFTDFGKRDVRKIYYPENARKVRCWHLRRKWSDVRGNENSENQNGDFDGIVLDSNGYGDKINHIELSHARMMAIGEILTENEQTVSRSELWKLMRVARIARPGAFYDASASAQTFPTGEMVDFWKKQKVRFLKMKRIFS